MAKRNSKASTLYKSRNVGASKRRRSSRGNVAQRKLRRLPIGGQLGTLNELSVATPAQRKLILSRGRGVTDAVSECCLNLVRGNLKVDDNLYKKLRGHKAAIRELSKVKTPLYRRQQIIQRGGFLHLLLPAVVPLLAKLFGA